MGSHIRSRSVFDSSLAPIRRSSARPALFIVAILLASMADAQEVGRAGDAHPKIAQVFFAQHHVLPPDNPLFKLVGDMEALIKVQAYSQSGLPSPAVFARLMLNSKVQDLPLNGPAHLPKPPAGDPLLLEHRYEDSFTAFIPREWIRPGLTVAVEMRERTGTRPGALLDRVVCDKIRIGAPTRLVMTMFDFHFFGGAKGADYPKGWFEELGSKLPVAELELRRVRNIVFDKLVMNPREGAPATLCGSKDEYLKKTGVKFDGEQAITQKWNGALKEAAGAGWGGTRRLYFSNIYGVWAGGQAGGLSGVGHGTSHGILLHELGHAFGLPDLAKPGMKYPYIGPMHGIQAPGNSATAYHVGPTWAFDPLQHVFIAPRTRDGCYARDPMGGGGANKDGGPGLYRFFSDYHFSRVRDCLEQTQVIPDKSTGRYFQWNQQSGSYSTVAREQGQPNCPVEDDIDVISVLASASMATPEANIVYPPIGPYKAGYIEFFDASSSGSRSKARRSGYDDSNCNVCLRVTQGGKVRTCLVKDGLNPKGDKSFCVFAINMPARDGEVTQADLLDTPNVMSKGVASTCKVLYSWSRASSRSQRTETVTATYPKGKEPARSDSKTASSTAPKAARDQTGVKPK
jgi:hypothetical protein